MTDQARMLPGESVVLSVPASTAYVGVLRSLAAGLAGRLDLDLDHVEDLRLSVSEACAVVLPQCPPGAAVTLRLQIGDGTLGVIITAPTRAVEPPGAGSFAWTVLTALADEASSVVADGELRIILTFRADGDPSTLDEAAGADLS